jgi:hypothetical protein
MIGPLGRTVVGVIAARQDSCNAFGRGRVKALLRVWVNGRD